MSRCFCWRTHLRRTWKLSSNALHNLVHPAQQIHLLPGKKQPVQTLFLNARNSSGTRENGTSMNQNFQLLPIFLLYPESNGTKISGRMIGFPLLGQNGCCANLRTAWNWWAEHRRRWMHCPMLRSLSPRKLIEICVYFRCWCTGPDHLITHTLVCVCVCVLTPTHAMQCTCNLDSYWPFNHIQIRVLLQCMFIPSLCKHEYWT